MRQLLKKYSIITLSLYLVMQVIPAVAVSGGWQGLFYASFILALLLVIARPIANLILLPFNLLTLNLTSWLLNIILLYFWTLLTVNVKIIAWEFHGGIFGPITLSPFHFYSWQSVIIAAIFLTLVIQLLNWILD